MTTQIQCRNCGGYRVRSEKRKIRETEEVPANFRGWIGSFLMLALFAFAFVFGSLFIPDPFTAALFMLGGIGTGIMATYSFVREFPTTRKKAAAGTLKKKRVYMVENIEYSCVLCGYRWDDSDTSQPIHKARQDLIFQGARRLEEEAEAERQRAAEAFYWEQQRKKASK